MSSYTPRQIINYSGDPGMASEEEKSQITGDFKMTSIAPITKVDPRIEPKFIESILCVKSKGLNRRIKKLMLRRKELIAELRDNHEKVKDLQIQSLETQKQLFEQQKLITFLKPQQSRTISKVVQPREKDILNIIDTMNDHDRAVLIAKLMDSGIIKNSKNSKGDE
jgi:TolA-binding protein